MALVGVLATEVSSPPPALVGVLATEVSSPPLALVGVLATEVSSPPLALVRVLATEVSSPLVLRLPVPCSPQECSKHVLHRHDDIRSAVRWLCHGELEH